jgi:DNA-binding transcriptional MerR regulator
MTKQIKIPDKLYFKLAEVLKLAAVQPYVLKYWETEFPQLAAGKQESGQRVYTRQDLDIILRIKKLLYEDGYTISGAKKQLDGEVPAPPAEPAPAPEGNRAADAEPPAAPPEPVASPGENEVKYKAVLEGALADLKALLASLQN